MKKLFSVFLAMASLVVAIGSATANDKNPTGQVISAVANEIPVLPPQGFINNDRYEYVPFSSPWANALPKKCRHS